MLDTKLVVSFKGMQNLLDKENDKGREHAERDDQKGWQGVIY
jgi:hypothetical protein